MVGKSVKSLLEKRKRQKLNRQQKSSPIKANPLDLNDSSKLVKAQDLKWKPVTIPDTLDDFEGFYGLEEIDGVGVKVVNGKMHFVVDNEKNLKTAEEKKVNEDTLIADPFELDAQGKATGISKRPLEDDDDDSDEEVLQYEDSKEVQDEEEVHEEIEEQEEEEEAEEQTKEEEEEVEEEEEDEDEDKADAELSESKFSMLDEFKDEDLELEEAPNVELPKWTAKIPSLSKITLNSLKSMDYKEPTPIQASTIPLALAGKDVIGKAITGSGKTLAYGLPIFEKALLTKKNISRPNGIIFAPTRELANQVMKHLQRLVESSEKFSGIRSNAICTLTGGLSIQKQERILGYNPRIIVATPGRCLELMEKSDAIATKLASTDILVFDEADRMLQDGHFEELDKILEVFNSHRPKDQHPEIPKKWQTLVFSATFAKDLFGKLDKKPLPSTGSKKPKNGKPADDEAEIDRKEVMQLLSKKLRFRSKPDYVDVNPHDVVANRVTEALIPCGPTERDLFLYYFLLMFPGTTLVFTNSIDSVKRLQPMLNHLKIPTVSIHSMMIQKQRLRSLERFQANSVKAGQENISSVLIASDVAARGLDISGIKHVIHYHLPRSADVYIHRSGRTARAGTQGVSVILCSPQEASGPLKQLRKIVSKNDKVDDIKTLPLEIEIVSQLKERIDLAAKLADSELNSQATNKETNWVRQAAEELGIEDLSDLEEDDFLKRDRKRKQGKQITKQDSSVLKAQLKQLLSHPIRKIGRTSYISSGLTNVAQLLVDNENNLNKSIMGHLQQDALDVLKVGRKFKTRDEPMNGKTRGYDKKGGNKKGGNNRNNKNNNKRQKTSD